MSASDSDEYRADDDRCGSTQWAATTLSWGELLVNARGLNLGPWGTWDGNPRRTGYEFNWARSGANVSSMIGFGQHTGLAAQVTAGRVQYAVLAIGANDVDSGTAVFAGAYDGTWTQEQLDAKRSQMIEKITLAADTVLSAGLLGMVIEDVGNWMNASDAQVDYPDPAGRQRFSDFLNAVNGDIAALAAAHGVAFAPHAALEAYSLSRLNASGDLVIDGEVIETDVKGCDPHRARINDQTGHAGTVVEGLMANIMVIGPLNERYGLGIVPFTENDLLVNAGIRPATEDTTPPAVSLTAPAPDATISGAATTVSAIASDNVGVVGVQFQLDGVALGGEDTVAPYAVAWDTTASPNGAHALAAVARDQAGLTTTSVPVLVTVANTPPDTTPPSVSLTAPAPDATVSGLATPVSATASDNVGVVGVQFRLDGANLGGEDTAAPYAVTWDTTASTNGPHTLTAIARDEAGLSTTSAPVGVTVSNIPPDLTPPTVALSAPSPGATVSGTSTTVSATASDNVGVVGVQFRLDGANLGGEDTVAPYAVTWNTTASLNGSHALTAIARDAGGLSTTSAAVTVTVSNPPPPASAALNDEFDGVTLDPSWMVVSPQLVTAAVLSGGSFMLQPAGNTYWSKAEKGPFYYKSVTGNFKMTAAVRVRKVSAPSQYVGAGGCKYAGLMVRSATGDTTSSQNYLYTLLGNNCQAAYDNEYKSTKNSASSIAHRAVANSDGEIRICRVAKVIYLLHRTAGSATWTQGKNWTRSDLPTALQVGMAAYSYKTAANDVQGQFDYVRFAPAPAYADCTTN